MPHSKEHCYSVYILTNQRTTCFYIGVSNNLMNRQSQHATKHNRDGFTAKYNIDKLVYFEQYQFIQDAIVREKQLK